MSLANHCVLASVRCTFTSDDHSTVGKKRYTNSDVEENTFTLLMMNGLYSNGRFVASWHNVSSVTPERTIYYEAERKSGLCGCTPTSPQYGRHEVVGEPAIAASFAELGWNDTAGKSALLVVNPVAGGDTSRVNAMQRVVVDILMEAGMFVHVNRTEARGDGRMIVIRLGPEKLRDLDVLIVVGGDGTLREVSDGLLNMLQTGNIIAADAPALGLVPSGSGNAIARSLGIHDAYTSALNIIHGLRTGRAARCAVLKYTRADTAPMLCMCGVQWGAIADIDQDTEWLRSLGKVRFDLGGIAAVISKRMTQSRMRLTLHKAKHAQMRSELESKAKNGKYNALDSEYVEATNEEIVIEGAFSTVVAWTAPFISEDCMFLPFAKPDECDAFDVTVVRGDITRCEMLNILTSVDDGSFVRLCRKVECFKVTRLQVESMHSKYFTVDGEAEPVAPFVLEIASESGQLRILNGNISEGATQV